VSGDAALAASAYDKAIELYTLAIDLDGAIDTTFANRCKAKLRIMLWEEALADAQKVLCHSSFRSPNSSCHTGHRTQPYFLHWI